MRFDTVKESTIVGVSTTVLGFGLQKLLPKLGIKREIAPLTTYFLLGFASHLVYSTIAQEATGKTPALGETDPDIETVLDVEGHIHPDIKKQRTRVMGPHWCQIYGVKFFDKEWCEALVRISERYGDWDSKAKGDGYSAGMTLPIDFIPDLQKRYSAAVKKYLFPCAQKLFPTFKPTHHDEVYILRYIAGKRDQDAMDHHYDAEPLACILGLNEDFTGGGTHFPQFKLTVVAKPGVMLLYPGGLSHLHGGKKINSGRRYALLHALYDRVLNGDNVSVWEEGEPQHDRDVPPLRGNE
jgi:hypothetical protein